MRNEKPEKINWILLILTCMILIITLISFFVGMVSAETIYAGESHSIVIRDPFEFYSVVGNSTPIDLTIELNGLNATITFGKYNQEDSFEIVFFNKEKEIITIYESSGSSGKSTTKWKTEYKNVTEYVDKETIKEIDKEVPVEKIVNKIPIWIWIIIGLLVVLLIGLWIWHSDDKNEDYSNEIFSSPPEEPKALQTKVEIPYLNLNTVERGLENE